MTAFIPSNVPKEDWSRLEPNRVYAVRCRLNEPVALRLGEGVGLYLAILSSNPDTRIVRTVNYDDGETSLVAGIPNGKSATLGRTDECPIKIMHAIVSRKHADFALDGEVLLVKDLGSTNGTFINASNPHFDIEKYIMEHPPEKGHEGTTDWVHEEFGATIDDFLKRFKEKKLL